MSGTLFLFLCLAYLCGSIPSAKLLGKLQGVDIQKQGSGNPGFANAVRVLGWRQGVIVLAADVLKGLLPVLLAQNYLEDKQILAVGLAAVLGHVFPVWLRFKGGKGIATGLGITIAIAPWAALVGAIAYVLGVLVLKKSFLASLLASWCLPVLCLAFYPGYMLFYLVLAVFGIWTHRTNLKSMLEG